LAAAEVTIGAPGYRQWRPSPQVGDSVAWLWAEESGAQPAGTGLVLPDGCIDIIWDGGSVFVAGPDTGPVQVGFRPRAQYAGLRFRPGHAPRFLGVAASELADRRVPLADLRGQRAAGILADRLAGTPDATWAAELIADAVAVIARDAAPADPVVGGLLAWLARRPPSARAVRAACAELEVSERQLHRRCLSAVGYGPKMLERVLRFQRARSLAGPGTALALVAAEAGYADQAHLSRECRRLSGLSPSDLFKTATRAAA
jgi:AraC-like DNA-binding protein